MKDFSYEKIIDEKQSQKIVRHLIYAFFKGNIQKRKIMQKGVLKDKTYFSFKRPFYAGESRLCLPSELYKLFPMNELYVLRHYHYKNNSLPLFLASSTQIVDDLENIDEICFYEYSYIFDKNFSLCFFITDSTTFENGKNIPILQAYEPI